MKGVLFCCSERKEKKEKTKLENDNPESKKQIVLPDYAFQLEAIDEPKNCEQFISQIIPVEHSHTYEVLKLIRA